MYRSVGTEIAREVGNLLGLEDATFAECRTHKGWTGYRVSAMAPDRFVEAEIGRDVKNVPYHNCWFVFPALGYEYIVREYGSGCLVYRATTVRPWKSGHGPYGQEVPAADIMPEAYDSRILHAAARMSW